MKTINQFNDIFEKLIKKYQTEAILIAISGGQDSISLIKIINKIKKKLVDQKSTLITDYIYIDHQWKQYSKDQIKHIINYIKSIGQTIHIYQIKNVELSEHRCRTIRYHTIIQHAIRYKYKLIITAHNETDKIETLLQNFVRGCGLEGITSLNIQNKVHENVYLIRPLININRQQSHWICKKMCLPIWSDSTNYIYNISRNRIRYELIPYIKKYLDHNIESNIKYLQRNYYYDNEYIKQNTIKLYLKSRHKKYISMNWKQIKHQNFALQSRIIQLFCFYTFNIYLDYDKITHIIAIKQKRSNNSFLNIKNKDITFHFNRNNTWLYAKLKYK
uniref:tRNA(Ile)-lysidine synthase, chloroplastic n=1 Tax=Osmundaria fimbriata TaxID=228265 RepID=A0A1Z1M4R4_OSMFI|nr:tRNA Ile-lysidine synthetase [Osmundaria fimbriata]ARW60764.1 tRNA Ile-lysidine synthetase [Osmundaria fimbriata]